MSWDEFTSVDIVCLNGRVGTHFPQAVDDAADSWTRKHFPWMAAALSSGSGTYRANSLTTPQRRSSRDQGAQSARSRSKKAKAKPKQKFSNRMEGILRTVLRFASKQIVDDVQHALGAYLEYVHIIEDIVEWQSRRLAVMFTCANLGMVLAHTIVPFRWLALVVLSCVFVLFTAKRIAKRLPIALGVRKRRTATERQHVSSTVNAVLVGWVAVLFLFLCVP